MSVDRIAISVASPELPAGLIAGAAAQKHPPGAWLRAWHDGYAQALEYWPPLQRAAALVGAGACACAIGMWLCAAADVSGRTAQAQQQTELSRRVAQGRVQIAGLPALRSQAQAMGATHQPEPVPDNGALLALISQAVTRSETALDVFEPAAPRRVQGVDEALVHVRVHADYARLARFAGELAVLAQPVLPAEMRVMREPDGTLSLDAQLRVIGVPLANAQRPQLNLIRKPGQLADPFQSTDEEGGIQDVSGENSARMIQLGAAQDAGDASAAEPVLGTLQAGSRRAGVLRNGAAWTLTELPPADVRTPHKQPAMPATGGNDARRSGGTP